MNYNKLQDFEIFIKNELTDIFEKDLNKGSSVIISNENFLNSKIKSGFKDWVDKPKFKSIFNFIPSVLVYDNINKVLYKKGKVITNCFLTEEVPYPYYFSVGNTVGSIASRALEEIKKDQINKIANYFNYLTKFNSVLSRSDPKDSKSINSSNLSQIQLNIYTFFYVFMNEISTNLINIIKDIHHSSCKGVLQKELETTFPSLFGLAKEESILL